MDNQTDQRFQFNSFPEELKLQILSYMPPNDIANFRGVSKSSQATVDNATSLYLSNLTPQEVLSYLEENQTRKGLSADTHVSVIKAFLNHATPERLPEAYHRVPLLEVVAWYGSDAERDAILAEHITPERLPEAHHRVRVLMAVAEHGNDTQRDNILIEHATPERLPDANDRAAVLTALVLHGKADLSEEDLLSIFNNSNKNNSILTSIAESNHSTRLFPLLIAAAPLDAWQSGGAIVVIAKKAVGDKEIYTQLVQNPALEHGTADEMIGHLNEIDDIDILVGIRDHTMPGAWTSDIARKKIHNLHSEKLKQNCTNTDLFKIIGETDDNGILKVVKAKAMNIPDKYAVINAAAEKGRKIRQPLNRHVGHSGFRNIGGLEAKITPRRSPGR